MSKLAHLLAALLALAVVVFTIDSARAEGEEHLLTVNADAAGKVQVTGAYGGTIKAACTRPGTVFRLK